MIEGWRWVEMKGQWAHREKRIETERDCGRDGKREHGRGGWEKSPFGFITAVFFVGRDIKE